MKIRARVNVVERMNDLRIPDAGRLVWRTFGGPEGIRTLDLFHAMEARSQLRHRPTLQTVSRITQL